MNRTIEVYIADTYYASSRLITAVDPALDRAQGSPRALARGGASPEPQPDPSLTLYANMVMLRGRRVRCGLRIGWFWAQQSRSLFYSQPHGSSLKRCSIKMIFDQASWKAAGAICCFENVGQLTGRDSRTLTLRFSTIPQDGKEFETLNEHDRMRIHTATESVPHQFAFTRSGPSPSSEWSS